MKTQIIRSVAKSALTFILLCGACGLPATHAWEALPPELDGTMMPYDFTLCDSVTPWEGTTLKPVAVSYVGRHGSRYLSSERKVKPLLTAIARARTAGSLTPEGEAFARLMDTVWSVSADRWGDLSAIGVEEENRLGREFCLQLAEMTDGKLTGLAESSCVPRVVRTMWEFLYPVAARSESNTIATDEGKQFSPLVRFFETDRAYVDYIDNGCWKEVYDEFFNREVSAEPARRLFGDIADSEGLKRLTLQMYEVMQSFRCTGLPAPTDRWMSVKEYEACWEVTNLKRYLTRSLTSLSTESMRGVRPLLDTILSRTEASLATAATGQGGSAAQGLDLLSPGVNARGLNANYWFGHAETLLPLVAIMGLPGCTALPLDYEQTAKEWRDYEITPMAANLMIVCLQDNPEGEVYTAVRLNGKWVSPLKDGRLMPGWKETRAYWEHRASELTRGN